MRSALMHALSERGLCFPSAYVRTSVAICGCSSQRFHVCRPAPDDSKAIQAAVDAASQAAILLNTYDCSTKYRQKRCMVSAFRGAHPIGGGAGRPAACHPRHTTLCLHAARLQSVDVDVWPHLLPWYAQIPHNGFLNQGKQGVAVLLPPGTYVLTRSVSIVRSNVVLRGTDVSWTQQCRLHTVLHAGWSSCWYSSLHPPCLLSCL